MSSYYFDLSKVNLETLLTHLSSSPSLSLDPFLFSFSPLQPLFSSLRPPDQLDLLLQLVDFLSKALLNYHSQTTAHLAQLSADKAHLDLIVKTLNQDLSDLRDRASRGFDFSSIIKVNKKVIKLQAWFRMKIIAKRMKARVR